MRSFSNSGLGGNATVYIKSPSEWSPLAVLLCLGVRSCIANIFSRTGTAFLYEALDRMTRPAGAGRYKPKLSGLPSLLLDISLFLNVMNDCIRLCFIETHVKHSDRSEAPS